MGTRNEELADYFIKAAGIAAVKIGPLGTIGIRDAVGVHCPTGHVLLCCERGKHTLLAVSVFSRMVDTISQDDTVARIREAAGELLIGITDHATVVERAMAAVAAVNNTIHEMQLDGRLRDLNRAFKASRKADRTLRYFDFLHAHKAAMLEAIASGKPGAIKARDVA